MSILQLIKPVLQASTTTPGQMSWDGWIAEQEARAEKVELYRDYADGEHRASLTPEMRAMLRIQTEVTRRNADGTVEAGSPFNLNHMDNVITTMADRLTLTGIDGDNKQVSEWIQGVLERNRIDGLQIGVHEGALRDADTFVMVAFDNETGSVTFSHEEAFDGVQGMLVVYPDRMAKTPVMAIRVWPVTTEGGTLADAYRLNIYYPDRIEKYIGRGGHLQQHEVEGEAWPAPWRMPDGTPIGVPVVHFPNRRVRYNQFGKSELDDAIPIQDAINRTMVSMVMASELTAFLIRTAKGFTPPAALTPGMFITMNVTDANGDSVEMDAEAIELLKAMDVGALVQGELSPFIEQERFLIEQLYTITKTPMQGTGSDAASGESLKQREIGLLGKVRRSQVAFGNAWEDVAALAWRVQTAFGREKPPTYQRFTAKWASAEIRDEAVLVKNVKEIADLLDERTVLEELAPVFGWDAAKIDKIMAAKAADRSARAVALGGGLPGFGNGFAIDRVMNN